VGDVGFGLVSGDLDCDVRELLDFCGLIVVLRQPLQVLFADLPELLLQRTRENQTKKGYY